MTPQSSKSRRGLRSSAAVLVLLVWIAALAAVAYNRQGLIDWWRLRDYQAPAPIAALATDDTMTSSARKIFYVNQPQIQPKISFTSCNVGSEKAAILGCYHSNQAGIYVLEVSDQRLQGVEQVTAAHEMLHAAYDRLSAKEKQHVNALLQDYYDHDLHDQTIIDQMNGYKKSEPKDVLDEMHSVFGTEVDHLPTALERYYQRYFTDRSKVTAFYDSYDTEFTSRQATIKADDAQLASMKSQIDAVESDLKTKYATLQSRQAQLNALRSANSISAYNAAVPGFNALVDAYNAQVAQVKTLISQYNQLVEARNSVALEAQQLQNEITSNVSSISK